MDYDELSEWLADQGMDADAAAAHGGICGLNVSPGRADTDAVVKFWVDLLFDETPDKQPPLDLLRALRSEYAAELDDDEFGLRLRLPSDNAPIGQRLDALASWTRAFLHGLVGGQLAATELTDEVKELIRDFTEIARVDAESEGDDSSEEHWLELSEYVRIGVLFLYETLRPDGAPAETIH